MKRKAVGVLTAVMLTSLTGCSGAQAQATNANNVTEISTTTESADVPIESTITEETSSIPESEVEPVYIEYEDLFLADNFYELNRERLEEVDEDSIEKTNEEFVLSESVDLYNFEGTWNGYTKPNIKVTLFGTNEDWAEVSFISMILYVPRADFDKVAVKAEEIETEEVLLAEIEEPAPKETTPTQPKTETPAPVASEPVVAAESVVTEEPATTQPVADNDKYTPEEAIAVYRGIIEANGIQWNPSIKEFASWGTGFIYLKKGYPEWAGNSAVESYKMGDGAGNPMTQYYIEITGTDENAVYYTGWNCD